jgi:hypothetical protein
VLLTSQVKSAGQLLDVAEHVVARQWWLLAQPCPSAQSALVTQPDTHPIPDGHEQGTASQTVGAAASPLQSSSLLQGCCTPRHAPPHSGLPGGAQIAPPQSVALQQGPPLAPPAPPRPLFPPPAPPVPAPPEVETDPQPSASTSARLNPEIERIRIPALISKTWSTPNPRCRRAPRAVIRQEPETVTAISVRLNPFRPRAPPGRRSG